jgi:plastocyanin
MTRLRPPSPPPRVAAIALVVALAAGPVACSSGDDSSSPSGDAPTTAPTTDATEPPPCVSRMPGQQLSEQEAVVGFNRENVCPGYVTVAAGTEVTWRNDDTEPFTVEVTSAGSPVAASTVEPGETWRYEFADAGAYEYRTDALPDFVGIVEVQPDPAAGAAPDDEVEPVVT